MAAPMKITFGPCCRQILGLSRRLASTQTTSSHGDTSLPPSAIPISDTPRMLCRTSESDPAKHRLDQEGLFYTVPPEHQDKFFLTIPKRIRQMRSAFNETAIMVRKPAVEVIQHLHNANYEFPINRYVLYGDVGNGKTTSLEHILHYCYTQGWIIGHLPWPKEYNMSYGDQMHVVESTYKPGRVDLPMRGVQWLTNFMRANSENQTLKEVTIENRYVWTKRESAEVGESIMKSIDFGINRPKYATDVVGLVVKELKAAANAKKIKLMFAVDGANAFWEPSTTRKAENPREKYNIEDFSLVHNFKKLLKNDWSNGAVVCTVDANAQMEPNPSNTLPQALLGPQGFAHLEPFLPIHVPRYNEKEIRCAIEYLYDRRWFSAPPSEAAKKEIIFLSQRNGRELMRVTASWQ